MRVDPKLATEAFEVVDREGPSARAIALLERALGIEPSDERGPTDAELDALERSIRFDVDLLRRTR